MLRKALCVALSLSLLAATVISSATNTAEKSIHKNEQNVSILESSPLGCGHYYFASILECLLGSSSKSRSFNGTLPRFPQDISFKILSYLAPVKLHDPTQIQTALNSLYCFEKLYGLNRYMDEITIEQINALQSMESELRPLFQQNPNICNSLLISRKHVLRSLGCSLSLKLNGLPSAALLRTLLESTELLSGLNAVQTAIDMVGEEISETFNMTGFNDDMELHKSLWILLGTKCYDFVVIRRFAQKLPESLTCSRYVRFLPIVPFEYYSQYLECCTDKSQETDAELRALSNLLEYCPMIKRNEPDLQYEYFKKYKELIDKYASTPFPRRMLDGIITIKYGLENDIAAIDPSLIDGLFGFFGLVMVHLFWGRSDFDCVQKRLQSINNFHCVYVDIVIDPKRFFKLIIDGQSLCFPNHLFLYNLHKASNTTAKADFEAELFGFVEVFAYNKKDLASIDQLEMLLYALDYAYKINKDNVVELVSTFIREQILIRDEGFFACLTELSCQPWYRDGPLKRICCTLCLPGLHPIAPMGTFPNGPQLISISIRTADFETLKLLVAFVKDLVLVEFRSNLENNAVLPKHMPQFIDILGYSQADLLLALCKTSTDSWLINLFKSAEGSFQGHDKLPRFHSLWYYLWMANPDVFTKNADAALVQFYESRYGN